MSTVTKEPDKLLEIRHLHKKFCKDIRHNMLYGLHDVWNLLWKKKVKYTALRKNEFWVLKDINLSLYEGEIVGIAGSNGSGKTSMMRIIANIYPNDMGEVIVKDGVKTTAVFALQAGMHPLYTGRENVYVKASVYGMTKAQVDEKMPFIISFSELEDHIDQPFGNYSSGMKARLAFAVAIATEPNIFILDEALAVGDAIFKTKCFEFIKEYVKEKPGRAVLFVSSNVRKILRVATRAVIIRKGRLLYDSEDLKGALLFYVRNCLDHLPEDRREEELKKVMKYDF